MGDENLQIELGRELADVLHYTLAIVALNSINMNDIILSKDKEASIKYNHNVNLEQFIINKRNSNNQ